MKNLILFSGFVCVFGLISGFARADTIRLTNADVVRENGKITVKCKSGADRVYLRTLPNGYLDLNVNGSHLTFTQAEAFGMEIRGGDGNDEIMVDSNVRLGLKLKGNDGNDYLQGGSGNDEIEGGDGADTINGGGGSDVIEGNDGNDRINGGGGRDDVRGNSGSDTYVNGNRTTREREVVRVQPRTVYVRPYYHPRNRVVVRVP
ncbi:MAG: hypothetical protein K1Y36_15895 [Blastocatellia bacterium]|nr:hypothetical protein [Blastocatellia bacterium]